MAGPQLENGFTQIANELLERLAAACLPGQEMAIMLVLFRLCYSVKKRRSVSLSARAIAKFLESDFSWVSKKLRAMEKKNLILLVKPARGRTPAEYSIQKNWQFWETERKTAWPPLLGIKDTLEDDLAWCSTTTREELDYHAKDHVAWRSTTTQQELDYHAKDRESSTSIETGGPLRHETMGLDPLYRKKGGASSDHDLPAEVIMEAKKELFRITDISPTTKDYYRVRAVARIPTPNGWTPGGWKQYCLKTITQTLKLVAQEARLGAPIGSVYAVACSRARQKLQTEAMQGERHDER